MTEGGPRTRTLVERGAEHLLLPSFRLEVVTGADAGASVAPGGDRIALGTHRSNDLVLHDETVSRFHCELTATERGVRVRDLGSRNRTLLGGQEVVEAYLRRPAMLTLGDTEVLVAPGTDDIRVPLAAGDRFGALRGAAPAMRAVFAQLERAAASDATVLIEGETGTGKDLAASAIHAASARGKGPFVVVDCGAVPGELIESALFGHLRGAFTGAHEDRLGAFQEAHGGVLFLDEIGELELALQPTLLRALEAREVRPVGSARSVAVNVRVIAATNRSLAAEVNAKRFRSDLYYRLAVLVFHMPPLRERPEDIPLLVDALIESSGLAGEPGAAHLRSPATLERLARHPWPGNVRELRNLVERSIAMGELASPVVTGAAPAEARWPVNASQPYRRARAAWLAAFERSYLEALLAAHDGNVTAAARAAGVDRVHLHRLLSRAGLR